MLSTHVCSRIGTRYYRCTRQSRCELLSGKELQPCHCHQGGNTICIQVFRHQVCEIGCTRNSPDRDLLCVLSLQRQACLLVLCPRRNPYIAMALLGQQFANVAEHLFGKRICDRSLCTGTHSHPQLVHADTGQLLRSVQHRRDSQSRMPKDSPPFRLDPSQT